MTPLLLLLDDDLFKNRVEICATGLGVMLLIAIVLIIYKNKRGLNFKLNLEKPDIPFIITKDILGFEKESDFPTMVTTDQKPNLLKAIIALLMITLFMFYPCYQIFNM